MNMGSVKKFTVWSTIILLIGVFVLPFAQLTYAAEIGVGHELMDMGCEGDGCEDPSAQQSCLEHCLQTNTLDGVIYIITPNQDDLQAGVVYRPLFERPVRKGAERIVQTTGPPDHTEIHLTTQKRE